MVADRRVGEALVKGSDLDWTLVYASRLKDGPRAGYKLLPGKVPMNASITRADVAAALVTAVDDPSAVRQVRNVAGNEAPAKSRWAASTVQSDERQRKGGTA